MATERSIDIGMLFRKMYCARCGERLARKEIRNTYRRGEPGFRNTLTDRSTINISSYTTIHYVYRCPGCGEGISYDEQLKISKVQKALNKTVLAEDERP